MSPVTYSRWSRDAEPRGYDLCSNDKHVQFYFWLRPGFEFEGKPCEHFGVTVSPDRVDEIAREEGESVHEVACALLAYVTKRYIYSSDKKRLEALVPWLETHDWQDRHDVLAARIADTEKALGRLRGAMERIEDERPEPSAEALSAAGGRGEK